MLGGQVEYQLFDRYDVTKSNPVNLDLSEILRIGDSFDRDDITYLVEEKHWDEKNSKVILVLRTTRQRIDDKATQVVHKCPSLPKKSLNSSDMIDLKRAKMSVRGQHLITACPFCKIEFWKVNADEPEGVEIDKTFDEEYFNDNTDEDEEGFSEDEDLHF